MWKVSIVWASWSMSDRQPWKMFIIFIFLFLKWHVTLCQLQCQSNSTQYPEAAQRAFPTIWTQDGSGREASHKALWHLFCIYFPSFQPSTNLCMMTSCTGTTDFLTVPVEPWHELLWISCWWKCVVCFFHLLHHFIKSWAINNLSK